MSGGSDGRDLRVGLLGCGRIAERVHLPTLARLSGVRLVALAEADPSRRDAVSWRFPEAELVDSEAVAKRRVEVFVDARARSIPLFERADLEPGQRFEGPCVIAQSDCTTCVPGAMSGQVDAYRTLVIRPAT